MARFHSFYGWIIIYYVSMYISLSFYIYISILKSIHPWMVSDCLLILAVANNVAMNMCMGVHISFWVCAFISFNIFDKYPKVNCWIIWRRSIFLKWNAECRLTSFLSLQANLVTCLCSVLCFIQKYLWNRHYQEKNKRGDNPKCPTEISQSYIFKKSFVNL